MAATHWKTASLVLVGCALLAALILWVDPRRVFGLLAAVDPVSVALCCGVIAGATLLGGLNLFMLLDNERRASFRHFLPIYWLAWGVGQVFPGQVGDLVALSMFLKRQGIDIAFTLGNALLDKLISLTVIAAFAGAGLALATRNYWLEISLGMGAAILFVSLAAAIAHRLLTPTRLKRIEAWQRGRIHKVIKPLIEAAATIRTRPAHVVANLLLSVIKVALIGTCYWIMFNAFGVDELSLPVVTATAMAAGIVAYLPISLNGMGTVEATGIALFGALGIDPAIVVAVYLILRLICLTTAWIPAIVWLSLKSFK